MTARRRLLAAVLLLGCGHGRGRASSPAAVAAASPRDPLAAHPPRTPGECAARPVTAPRPGGVALRYDQLGYLPDGERWAVLLGEGGAAPALRVCDLSVGRYLGPATVPAPRVLDTRSLAGTRLTGDRVDLSALAHPGRYQVESVDGAVLGTVTVGTGVYEGVVPAMVAFLRAQRCGPTGMAVSGHGACHLHASVVDGDPATASGDGISVPDGFVGPVGPDSGAAVDVEGGWHDAGDYVKFVGTTAYVLAVDLAALRDHPRAPGAAGGALRDELRWGLAWLAKMVGGPVRFHQVSGEFDHDAPPRTPESDTAHPLRNDDDQVYLQRPAYQIDVAHRRGGNVLGRSAAAFALAAQALPGDAAERARWLALARDVYAAAVTLPRPQNPDPPGFYPEDTVLDDLALGGAELARATGEARYADEALADLRRALDPAAVIAPEPFVYWGDVTAFALLETAAALPADSAARAELVADLGAIEDPIRATRGHPVGPAGAFGYALPALGDGSIAQSLGAAMGCLAARRMGVGAGCDEVARRQLHWLFGQNPFGLSYAVGLGSQWPRAVHHALSQATGREVTGAIVGGPVTVAEFRHLDPDVDAPVLERGALARFATREVFYEDVPADFVTNEPAIDFTAALVWILAEFSDPPADAAR